ncbi:DUF3813 domain-containing protein [Halalkalibacter alkalisediminis]|uniref:DUF3813 domain-containing protein n=1 Tax=Halalkalibacter alkalisediminis TaxID=935616 RepID=A0ABV6NAK1_9BACI|nr:DUF3813 domain-containing protein [Halalkalibacter alkalisediminis]
MDNQYFLDARESVARFELLALAAETDIQREAVKKELQRAKMALDSAFINATPAEQDQLVHMQDQLNQLYDYNL